MKKLLFFFLLIPALVSAQIQTINIGATANDGTGDKLRQALRKVNENFVYTMEQVALKADATTVSSHIGNNSNPHATTKAQVGLSNVDNTSDANKPISTATQTAIDGVNATVSAHTASTSNPHSVTKTQVGLGNADNTSDANKPVSSATQTALDLKANLTDLLGVSSGALSSPYQLTFDTPFRTRTLTVANDLALSLAPSGKVANTIESITVTGDGVHVMTFPASWRVDGDSFNPYKIHKLLLSYDGTYTTGVLTIVADAPVPPLLASATMNGASTQFLSLLFDRAVNITTAGWSISASGGAVTVSTVSSGSGTITPVFTLSRAIDTSETITISYDPITGNTVNTSNGVELATLSGGSVTNSVYTIDLDVPFTGTTVDAAKGAIVNPDAANLTLSQNGNLRAVRTTDVAVAGSTTNYWRSSSTFTRGAFAMVMNKFTGFTNSIAYYQYRVDATHHISILKLGGQTNAYLRITNGTDVYTYQSGISITNRFRILFNASHEIRFQYDTGTEWEDIDTTNPVHTVNIGASGDITLGANSSASDGTGELFYWDELYVTSKPYPTSIPN